MAFIIPEKLKTERLLLRFFREDDWRDLHQLYSDVRCLKYFMRRVHSEGDSWRTLASLIGHWHLRGYGPYAVELKTTGQVIGPVGMWYPNDWPAPEIKWALAYEFWGNGYAQEAAKAVNQMANQCLPDLALISLIDSKNQRSIRVATAMGATFEKTIEFRGGHWLVYRHQKENISK